MYASYTSMTSMEEIKILQLNKNNPEKKNKQDKPTLSDNKIYYKAKVIKTLRYRPTNKIQINSTQQGAKADLLSYFLCDNSSTNQR